MYNAITHPGEGEVIVSEGLYGKEERGKFRCEVLAQEVWKL